MSYNMIRRWKKEFDSGLETNNNAPKSGRPKSASCNEIVSNKIVERDANFTVCNIAQMVGISLSRVYYILKNNLTVRKISARGCLIC